MEGKRNENAQPANSVQIHEFTEVYGRGVQERDLAKSYSYMRWTPQRHAKIRGRPRARRVPELTKRRKTVQEKTETGENDINSGGKENEPHKGGASL